MTGADPAHHPDHVAPGGWHDPEHARWYLARADGLPHRAEGEAVVVEDLAEVLPGRILDLGCGAGRLLGLLAAAFPGSTGVGLDLSPTMLDVARADPALAGVGTWVRHDLGRPLPVPGPFDAVVSSLAVHHVDDDRKRTLYAEAAARLRPGGVFANLDVVASATPSLHRRWREATGAADDPADRLAPVEPQLEWLRAAGLEDVDCIWRWRGLALLRGRRPG